MSRQEQKKQRRGYVKHYDDGDSRSTEEERRNHPASPDLINGKDFTVTGDNKLYDSTDDINIITPDTPYDFPIITFPTGCEPKSNRNQDSNSLQPKNKVINSTISTEIRQNKSVSEQDLVDRRLPNEINAMFPNITSHVTLIMKLFDIQNEEDRYCISKDDNGRRTTLTKQRSIPRHTIIEHFKREGIANSQEEDGRQILNYLKNPILQQAVYGILLYNSKGEILAVQDHQGYWNAPKNYRKITNSQLETIKETAVRVFNEQICVTNLDTNQVYDYYDVNDKHQLNLSNYVEYQFNNIPWGENIRSIALFLIKIDESKLAFNLRDTYENQTCQWFTLDDILYVTQANNDNIFYTLKPFVGWLQDHFMFNDNKF